MISWQELKNHPEGKRLISSATITALVWILAASFLLGVHERDGEARQKLEQASLILEMGSQYRAQGGGRSQTSIPEGEELTAVTDILEKIGVREKVTQLATAPKGISIQLDRLYKNEFEDLLSALLERGLTVKSAELKALPVKEERLFSVNLIVAGAGS